MKAQAHKLFASLTVVLLSGIIGCTKRNAPLSALANASPTPMTSPTPQVSASPTVMPSASPSPQAASPTPNPRPILFGTFYIPGQIMSSSDSQSIQLHCISNIYRDDTVMALGRKSSESEYSLYRMNRQLLSGSQSVSLNYEVLAAQQFSTAVEWLDCSTADFNGDQTADFIARVKGAGTWYAAMSSGSLYQVLFATGWMDLNWVNVTTGNLLGNGRDQLIATVDKTNTFWIIKYANGEFQNEQFETTCAVNSGVNQFILHKTTGNLISYKVPSLNSASYPVKYSAKISGNLPTSANYYDCVVGKFRSVMQDSFAVRNGNGEWLATQLNADAFSRLDTWDPSVAWTQVQTVTSQTVDGIIGNAYGVWWLSVAGNSYNCSLPNQCYQFLPNGIPATTLPVMRTGITVNTQITRYPLQGNTFLEKTDNYLSQPSLGYTDSDFRYAYDFLISPTSCGATNLRFTVTINERLPELQSRSLFPTYLNSLATRLEQQMENLTHHEEGHRIIALNAANRVFDKLSQSLTVPGITAENTSSYTETCRAILTQQINDAYQSEVQKIQPLHDSYDFLTQHGRTQGAFFYR